MTLKSTVIAFMHYMLLCVMYFIWSNCSKYKIFKYMHVYSGLEITCKDHWKYCLAKIKFISLYDILPYAVDLISLVAPFKNSLNSADGGF